MSINLSYRIINKKKGVNPKLEGLKIKNSRLMVWWYCGLHINPRDRSQPFIRIAFRKIDRNGILKDIITKWTLLTYIGILRIGTIWKEGYYDSEVCFDSNIFDLNYHEGYGWKYTSFYQSNKETQPFPQKIYPLPFSKDKNCLISFKLKSGGNLIIPSLEYFYRCYGVSAEIKRILATYPWDDAKNRLYCNTEDEERNGLWRVQLGNRLRKNDSIFVAHVKYDTYTNRRAKSIYAQIEAQYSFEKKQPIFIQAGPWYRGNAKLKVVGIPFNNGKSFLGLQITGSSLPEGPKILYDLANTNKVENPASENNIDKAWDNMPQKINHDPDFFDIVDDSAPDHYSSSQEIVEPDFEILGESRTIIDVYKYKAETESGKKIRKSDENKFSSGDPYGNGNGVGYAAFFANIVIESHGVLWDMWNATKMIASEFPQTIKDFDCLTLDKNSPYKREPTLIKLKEFGETEKISKTIRNWLYISKKPEPQLRGVLIIRVITDTIPIHILEFQRKLSVKKDKEESLTGVVFRVQDQQVLFSWLRQFLSEIRYKKGVAQNIIGACPGVAATFRHCEHRKNRFRGEHTVKNALTKVGIDLVKKTDEISII